MHRNEAGVLTKEYARLHAVPIGKSPQSLVFTLADGMEFGVHHTLPYSQASNENRYCTPNQSEHLARPHKTARFVHHPSIRKLNIGACVHKRFSLYCTNPHSAPPVQRIRPLRPVMIHFHIINSAPTTSTTPRRGQQLCSTPDYQRTSRQRFPVSWRECPGTRR